MTKPIHLVILIHGLFGSPANVATVAEELYAVHGSIDTAADPQTRGSDADAAGVEVSTSQAGGERYREVVAPSSGGRDRKDELVVYACNSFGFGHTWDGIDVNAQRAADEVRPQCPGRVS
jgi:hypothetical protein